MELTSQNGDYYLERRNDLVELGLMERDNYIPLDQIKQTNLILFFNLIFNELFVNLE